MPATADRAKVANARHGPLSTSAEKPLSVCETHGEFGIEGVGDSVESGEAGGDAAAFESGDG